MPKIIRAPIVFLIVALVGTVATAKERLIDDFSAARLRPEWRSQSFVNATEYRPSRVAARPCLRAVSHGAASGLVYRLDYDPDEYPLITWSWHIDHVLAKGDAHTKAGDDYAARLYVIFPSIFFWKTKVLNYVWANRLPKGEAIPNAFTANAMMIAVQSGNEHSGEWMIEQRNVYQDFLHYFGTPPGKVGAIAIMTDTDNTGEETAACYGPISIQSLPVEKIDGPNPSRPNGSP